LSRQEKENGRPWAAVFSCERCSLPSIINPLGGTYIFEKYPKTRLPIALFAGSFLLAVASAGVATAEGDSGAYLIGHWKLNDIFSDFKPPGSKIVTDNTEFVFLNPTNLTLKNGLEYAFFAADGTFCGCDRDTLSPNGRVRYTMLGEKQGNLFSTQLCPTQTDGTMKTIVFTSSTSTTVTVGDAVQAGYQIDLFPGNGRTEAPLLAVAINPTTTAEIQSIHTQCVGFLGPPSAAKKHPWTRQAAKNDRTSN
jgi:hypothetical protein